MAKIKKENKIMTKTKYDEVIEQLKIIKKQADYYLKYVDKNGDEQVFNDVLATLGKVNYLFHRKTSPLAEAQGEKVCPPGTYDCDNTCSATPCS